MAIKMDGHTITSLQLKASDGSEVTKQLTEEGTIPTPTGTKQITANGTYDVTNKASAVVAVPAPEINLQQKTATTNGDVVADEGYDGLEKVIVNVSGDVPTLITKTITENGTYNASADSADGYSSVTVNVPAPVLPTLTNPASASDILSSKEALDGNGAKLTGTCTYDADTSDADATAADIAKDKTAYVNGLKVVGTHEEIPSGLVPLDTYTFTVAEKIGPIPSSGSDMVITTIDEEDYHQVFIDAIPSGSAYGGDAKNLEETAHFAFTITNADNTTGFLGSVGFLPTLWKKSGAIQKKGGWYQNSFFAGNPITVTVARSSVTSAGVWIDPDSDKFALKVKFNGGSGQFINAGEYTLKIYDISSLVR